MSDPGSGPKLIIDDDWKSQAQAEKERLSEAETAKSKPAASGAARAGSTPADAQQGDGELPPADFQSLIGMLITQALMYMGGVADPKTGRAVFDPEMSRFYIDLIGVVEAKTKGNLSADESRDLTQALTELRSRYVELIKMVAMQAAQAKGGIAGGVGGPQGLSGMTGMTGMTGMSGMGGGGMPGGGFAGAGF